MDKQVILTGLRANNDLHIGNYFGALLPIVDIAKRHAGKYQVNLFVPDLHSFTTPIDHSKLKTSIHNTLRAFVAAGLPIDSQDVYLYRQSYIPAHSELTIILNSFTGMGELKRMTQFKDKSLKLSQNRISAGLFDYPVLMACDILLYSAEYVPVGDDQTQHLEFTRNIAEAVNNKFNKKLFIIPRPVKEQHKFFGKDQGLRIMDLSDPSKKMSKSDTNGKGIIFLNDRPEEAAKKIMSATTDNLANVDYDREKQPGISNLLQIHALLSGEDLNKVIEHHKGESSYGDLKKEVAEQVKEFLEDFQAKLKKVDDKTLMRKLEESEKSMNKIASETLLRVQKAVGLR